jgi:hypothetical protein
MSRRFDDALNDCLDRIARGEDIQHCLNLYPEHEQELAPLLSVAIPTLRVARSATYRPDARARGLSRLGQAMADMGAPRRRSVPAFWRQLARPVLVGFVAVFLLAVAAGGTTAAASDSIPGDPLYWVKTTRENLSLKLYRSDIRKAQVHAQLANEREEEVEELLLRGRYGEAQALVNRMVHHLDESAEHAGIVLVSSSNIEVPPTRWEGRSVDRESFLKLRALMEQNEQRMRATTAQRLQNLPPAQRQKMQQVLSRPQVRYRIIITAMNDRSQQRPFWMVVPPSFGNE